MAKILLARIKSAPPPVARLRLVGTLAQAAPGVLYESRLSIVGGGNILTASVRTGTRLPIGLSVSIDYGTRELVVSGTALETGAIYTELQVSDEYSQRAVRAVSWLLQAQPLAITGTLLNGAVGYAYSSGLSGSGGVGTRVWSMPSAPAWASIDPATGVITGTPDATFSSTITVRLTDSLGSFVEATPSLTIGTLWTLDSLTPDLHVTPESTVTNVSGKASFWGDATNPAQGLTQGTTARMPAIVPAALNGRRGLQFNGILNTNGSAMIHNRGATNAAKLRNVNRAWGVAVYKKTAADPSPVGRIVFRVNNNAGTSLRLQLAAGGGGAGAQNVPGGSYGAADGDAPVGGRNTTQVLDWHVALVYADYTTHVGKLWQNGVNTDTRTIPGATSTSDTDPRGGGVIIGSAIQGDAFPSDSNNVDMTLMEFALKGDGVLSESNIARIFGSLHWSHGLQFLLPDDHPYKLEPPLA